jgi:flavin reductase (DIM6/NTAB) family NADH-FMN oxidoreductase RutF/rubredoxin
MNSNALFTISYGLFVLGAKRGDGKMTGMVCNTLIQVTQNPLRLAVTLNKAGFTHDVILQSSRFTASVLSQSATFDLFRHFGFQSGRSSEKFDGTYLSVWDSQGIPYLNEMACARFSCTIAQTVDLNTHTLFIADVLEAETLLEELPLTYADYHANVKPKTQPAAVPAGQLRYECKICGYVHEGTLPEDFVCPICQHGAADFRML